MQFFLQIVLNWVSPIGQSSVLESPSGNHGKRMKGLHAAYALQAIWEKGGKSISSVLTVAVNIQTDHCI